MDSSRTAQKETPYSYDVEPRDEATADVSVRCSVDCLAAYLRSANQVAKQSAQKWATYKLDLVSSAVNPERIGRSSNEYFYAISRLVTNLAQTNLVCITEKPDDVSVSDKFKMLRQAYPSIEDSVYSALAGDPSDIKAITQDVQKRIGYDDSHSFIRRQGLPTHRCSVGLMPS